VVTRTSNTIAELSPSFFLSSNRSPYYVWHLPRGQRCRLVIEKRNIYLTTSEEGVCGHMIALKSDIDVHELLVGVTLTGYFISREVHTSSIEADFFVVDTMYDMRDPYTEKEMSEESSKVATLRECVTTFNDTINGLYLVAQTLYGINLAEWGNRIDRIWYERTNRDYPIVGLVFYEREGNSVYVWRYYPTVTAKNGDRVVLEDFTMYDQDSKKCRPTLPVEADPPRPEVLRDDQLGFDDMFGAGITIPLWYVRQHFAGVNRHDFLSYVASLTNAQKVEIASNILLSPRQIDLLA